MHADTSTDRGFIERAVARALAEQAGRDGHQVVRAPQLDLPAAPPQTNIAERIGIVVMVTSAAAAWIFMLAMALLHSTGA